ncbi:hypothetical protein J3E74DRAFT_440112 [Bipolaris maydis]|nr:hypothetical protein J3E74DRAFT_440112 [Bipolaris maydis]
MGSLLDKNAESARKRIANHRFEGENGEEYEGSAFGGFNDYFRRKKINDKPQIFKGIVAHVNGYTQPSLIDLHTLITTKAVEFRRYRIVKPAWVYRVLDEGETQNVLAFDGGNITTHSNIKNRGYRDQTDTSWYTSQLQGSQSGPSSTPTPSSPRRPRFSKSKQQHPTYDDDIEDLPPSWQPQGLLNPPGPRQSSKAAKLITPPKTSPALPPVDHEDIQSDLHNSLYAEPSPPKALHLPLNDQVEERAKEITSELDLPAPKNRPLTAEEHNAILLRDPKIRRSTVVDPNFLEQYYRESRLHHLSTWKADLKSQLQALANESSSSQKAKQKRVPGVRRYILHIDFDSFFAAVSLKKHPELKDKPAVVAHGQGSGSEIASCNYPARTFGIKNGMWMKRAQELCPDLKILPYDFPAYEETSRTFYDTILTTGGIVQSVSIDEALIDVSNLCIAVGGSDGKSHSEDSIYREQAKADEIALNLRDEVRSRTGCNVSVGIGSNILLAKLALRKAKPAGQHQIKPEEVLGFIGQLQVQDLPGVAGSIGGKLESIGVKLLKDVRKLNKERLIQTLGPKTGEKLYEYSRGIDHQEVGEQVIRKSVSAEVNWGVRFENQDQADEFIASLCGELQKRLLKERVKGKQFTMKVMRRSPDAPMDPPKHLGHGKCDTHSKSLLLGVATNAKEVLTKEALAMLRGFGFTPGELRGIGIQMTKLELMRSATDGTVEGSQPKLQFKVRNAKPPQVARAPQVVEDDPIQDDPETPRKSKVSPGDEHVAFGAEQLNASTPSRRPLNTLGTQFIMPSQVDPKVLDELPEDIRTKLFRQTRQSSPTPANNALAYDTPSTSSRALPLSLTTLPNQSQLDPKILAALPAEVRAEVLAHYASNEAPFSPSHRPRGPDQTILPQSPRKNKIIGIPANKPIVPVKRGRGRPPRSAMLAAAAQAKTIDKSGRMLTQANFISLKNPARENVSREDSAGLSDNVFEAPTIAKHDDLDPDFLAALPEDMRKEVIDQHNAAKLNAFRFVMSKKTKAPSAPKQPRPAPKIKVPRPPTATFTTQKLSTEPDLRSAMRLWISEFDKEGPYEEDVTALIKYLKKVVQEERDMNKAVGLVKWVGYIISDKMETKEGFACESWKRCLATIKDGVRRVCKEKGLGSVCFE